MPTPTRDVDDICDHQVLVDMVGGESEMKTIISPSQWGGDSKFIRTQSYRDILASLANRVPPIGETDLQDAEGDLREAVAYRALELLYGHNVTMRGDRFSERQKHFGIQYVNKLNSLSPKTAAGRASPGIGLVLERR